MHIMTWLEVDWYVLRLMTPSMSSIEFWHLLWDRSLQITDMISVSHSTDMISVLRRRSMRCIHVS